MRKLIRIKAIGHVDRGSVSNLLCPRCGADNLHHLGVTVFDRAEDAASVVRSHVSGSKVAVEIVGSIVAENPSRRRDGLAIQFQCEQCGGDEPDNLIELTIAQHKGSTEIGWRFTPKA